MHAAERPTKKRPRPLPYSAMILSLLSLLLLPAAARAQWTTTGSDISNSNAGNVGVGTGSNAPASRLEVVNPAGGYVSGNYFQVTGTTTDNNNYPGFQLKGGSWATEYPQFKLGNAGLAAFIWGGRSPTMGPNRMGLLLYSNLSNYAYASVQKFDGTNTTDLFVVRDSGSVGIGTLTPGYRLHVAGNNTSAGGYPVIKLENTQSGGHSWWLYSGATGTPGAFGLYDETMGSYRMYFDASGNAGIGTTSPGSPLTVTGTTGHSTPMLDLQGNGDLKMAPQGVVFFDGNYSYAAGSYVGPYSYTSGSYDANTIKFTTAGAERMRVTSGGTVGVGTATPNSAYKLDVAGSVNASGGLCIAGTCKTDWSQVSGGSQWGNVTGGIYYNTGNVGIGTATPQQRLDINYGSTNTLKGIAVSETNSTGTTGLTLNNTSTSGTSGILLNVGDSNKAFIKVDVAKNLTLTTENATDTGLNQGLVMDAGGNVGVGKGPTSQYKLDVAGAINASGAITGATVNATYQDVAEWVPSTQRLAAGTVVVLDTARTNHVLASTKAYDTGVAGVVSDNPGVILGQGSADKLKVATTGRVKVRVDATRAPIHVGDLLVTSEAEGVAMKSVPVDLGGVQIHRPGTIIGKALEPLEKGTGEILVLLSLQ